MPYNALYPLSWTRLGSTLAYPFLKSSKLVNVNLRPAVEFEKKSKDDFGVGSVFLSPPQREVTVNIGCVR